MRILLWAILACFVLSSNSTWAGEPEPAGLVYKVPVEVWNSNSDGPETTDAILLLPSVLDDQGTLTLLLTAQSNASLLVMERSVVPDSPDFIFGESEKCYLRLYRNIIFGNKSVRFNVDLPYDKSVEKDAERTLEFVDAAGKPLQGFRLRVALLGPFGNFSMPKVPIPIDSNGTAKLPKIKNPFQRPAGLHMQPSDAYSLELMDLKSGQPFTTSLRQNGETSQTIVQVPTYAGTPTADVSVFEGQVVNHDGTPRPGVFVSLSDTNVMRLQNDRMRENDPTTVTVTNSRSIADGRFTFAVSKAFGSDPQANLSVYANEGRSVVFETTYGTLESGEVSTLRLPKRLDLAVQFLDEKGDAINIKDTQKQGSSAGVTMIRSHADGSRSDRGYLSINYNETTGSVLNLKGLAVPGRFSLELNDRVFGPVEIGETSPTEIIAFQEVVTDGKFRGIVKTENSEPLTDALILISTQGIQGAEKYAELTGIIDKVKGMDTQAGLDAVKKIVPSAINYAITTGTGEFQFSRKPSKPETYYPTLIAVAQNRFGAYIQETTSKNQVPYTQDIKLPELKLPLKVEATGIVSAPKLVPDEKHLGEYIELPAESNKYYVFHWNSGSWYQPKLNGSNIWRYEEPNGYFEFGKPFKYPVPLGTSFTLGAMAKNLDLSLQLWKHGPVSVSDAPVELTSATLRALQPFYLKVLYSDGTPAEGIRVSALYGTSNKVIDEKVREPMTNAEGIWQLYGDEGLAPQISLLQFGPSAKYQTFKIQPLDMSTSVPTLTVHLDPNIWGVTGGTK